MFIRKTSGNSHGDLAAAFLVASSTAAAFWPVLSNGWVNWDDQLYILDNPWIRALNWENLRWMFTNRLISHYQPLSWLSYAADYALWGLNPKGYHLTSLLLHCLNAVLFFQVARKLLKAARHDCGPKSLRVAAIFAALIFSLHPLRVESVAWASERRDVLCGTFYLASLWAYLRGPGKPGWLAASWGFFVGALLSKGVAVSLPLVLIIMDFYPLRRKPSFRAFFAEKIPFFLAAAGIAILTLNAESQLRSLRTLEQLGWPMRLGLAARSLVFYLGKSLFPIGLSPLYEMPARSAALNRELLLSAAALAAAALLLWLGRGRRPALTAASLTYAITLFPVSGIFQSGPQIAADRYSYLACLSWALLAAAAFLKILESHAQSKPAVLTTTAVILLGLSALTWRQSLVWRDPFSLWARALSINPETAIAHNNLGIALANSGRVAEAAAHFQEALRIQPRCVEAQNRLFAPEPGADPEQTRLLKSAIEADPICRNARLNLATAYAALGRREEAKAYLSRLLLFEPDNTTARINLDRIK